MAEITKINTIGLAKFNNAEYTNFADRFTTLALTATAEALGIAEADFTAYQNGLATMNDLVAQSRISDETAEMLEMDKKRDDIGVYLLSCIRNERTSPITLRKESGVRLYNQMKPYTGFQKMANQQETVMIEGMLTDLNKKESAADIKTLGLEAVVEQLDSANSTYKALTEQRANSRIASTIDNSKKVRSEMDALYDTMTTLAFVQSVAKPTAATAAFVTGLNALIDEVNTLYNQRMAQAKNKKIAASGK